MRISDWSSDVCSSDLGGCVIAQQFAGQDQVAGRGYGQEFGQPLDDAEQDDCQIMQVHLWVRSLSAGKDKPSPGRERAEGKLIVQARRDEASHCRTAGRAPFTCQPVKVGTASWRERWGHFV